MMFDTAVGVSFTNPDSHRLERFCSPRMRATLSPSLIGRQPASACRSRAATAQIYTPKLFLTMLRAYYTLCVVDWTPCWLGPLRRTADAASSSGCLGRDEAPERTRRARPDDHGGRCEGWLLIGDAPKRLGGMSHRKVNGGRYLPRRPASALGLIGGRRTSGGSG